MKRSLSKLTIRGFKSIEALDEFMLEKVNVLIGANGTGKSNFVDFFRLLRAMADEGMARYVLESSGADGFFFLGPKYTSRIFTRLEFDDAIYEVDLAPTAGDEIMVEDERVQHPGFGGSDKIASIGGGNRESCLKAKKSDNASPDWSHNTPSYIYCALSSWTVYHFHDTSATAPMRRRQSAYDWRELRPDASNIAAFLMDFIGLHPYAITLLSDLIHAAVERTQLIVSTQSPTLLDHFEPDEIIVANREKGRTILSKLNTAGLSEWLSEYSISELWRKNIVQGGPSV